MMKLWSATAMTLATLMTFNCTIACTQTASEEDLGTVSDRLTASLTMGGAHYDVSAISQAEKESARNSATIESDTRATLGDGTRLVVERSTQRDGLVTAEGYVEKDGVRTAFSVTNLRAENPAGGGIAPQDFGLSAIVAIVIIIIVVVGGALCLQANSNAADACANPARQAMGCSLVNGVGTGGGTSSAGFTFYLGCTASCICPNSGATPPPIPVPTPVTQPAAP